MHRCMEASEEKAHLGAVLEVEGIPLCGVAGGGVDLEIDGDGKQLQAHNLLSAQTRFRI